MTVARPFDTYGEALAHWAKTTPNKTFLVDLSDNKKYSYATFDRLVNAATRLLHKRGVRQGDIVALRLPNSADFLILYFACIRGGFISNPYPVSMSDAELQKGLRFMKPKFTVVEEGTSPLLRAVRKLSLARKGRASLQHVLKKFSDAPYGEKALFRKAASVYLTSGSTGDPKAILYSHENLVTRTIILCRELRHTQDTVHLGFLPMGHTSITGFSVQPVTYVGGTLVIAENFTSIQKNFWSIIKKYRVRYVQMVPTVLFAMLNIPYRYSRKGIMLPYLACGSAPLPISTQRGFERKFSIPVGNFYGCSEAGSPLLDDPRKKHWKPGSIGIESSGYTTKLLGKGMKAVRTGEIGEIAVKSLAVCMGYFKNSSAFRKSMWRGYFRTGDLAYKDSRGRYFFADRKKDLIIRGGSNIFPGEIDEVLFKHPAILEACTIGVPDPLYGESVVSFVVLKNDVPIEELHAHCALHLQPLKRPRRIISVPKLPKTSSGKLLRKQLRELYETRYKK